MENNKGLFFSVPIFIITLRIVNIRSRRQMLFSHIHCLTLIGQTWISTSLITRAVQCYYTWRLVLLHNVSEITKFDINMRIIRLQCRPTECVYFESCFSTKTTFLVNLTVNRRVARCPVLYRTVQYLGQVSGIKTEAIPNMHLSYI